MKACQLFAYLPWWRFQIFRISMNCFKSLGQPRKSRCSHSQWNKNSPALLARSNSMVMSSTPQFQQKQNELDSERRDQITDTSPWWWSWKMTVTEKRGQFFNGCWPKSPRAFGCRALYVTERKRGSAGLTKNVAVQAILTKEFYPLYYCKVNVAESFCLSIAITNVFAIANVKQLS